MDDHDIRAMDDHDDPFKEMVDESEDDSTVDELEFDPNQFREARLDVGPENLHADGLTNFDREVTTNKSRPLFVHEILNEYTPQPVETVEMAAAKRMRFPTNPYHHHHEMKLTRQLKS